MESEPGTDAVGLPGPVGLGPDTGDDRVDEAVSRLADLAGLPVAEHPAVFGHVHERLTEALGDTGVHERVAPDDRRGQPDS